MINRNDLKQWVIDALRENGGKARIIDIAKYIWNNHKTDLERSGDLFFRWQYDMRWAALVLRQQGKLKPVDDKKRGLWELS
jgi:hypothetical protein